jgi:hypothetical protein
VCPALTIATASPRETHSAATRIEARGLRRRAAAGASVIHHLRRVDDADAGTTGLAVRDQSRLHAIAGSYEKNLGVEMPCSSDGAVNDGVGRMIAAHGVDRDPDHLRRYR